MKRLAVSSHKTAADFLAGHSVALALVMCDDGSRMLGATIDAESMLGRGAKLLPFDFEPASSLGAGTACRWQ